MQRQFGTLYRPSGGETGPFNGFLFLQAGMNVRVDGVKER
jgi:hypothetical protein